MQEGLASGWHVFVGGASYGPYEWTDLVAWVRDGRMGPDDLVWQARLPGWIPARQVPGLFSAPTGAAPWAAQPVVASHAPPAVAPPADAAAWAPAEAAAWAAHPVTPARTSGRRRLSGLMIAAICLAAVIVLGGAATGAWLGLRGDGAGATSAVDGVGGDTTFAGDDQPEIKVEELNLTGRVVLPEGAAISPADLAVLSNADEASCSAAGDFDVTALRDEGARTLIFALNDGREPMLMAIVESSTDDLRPSVASTARALVLYDPAFLSLPRAAYESAAAKLESHPELPALESALASVIDVDPSSPLDGDAHPEPYDLAAKIAADLLSDIIVIDENASVEQVAAQVAFASEQRTRTGGASAHAPSRAAPLLLAATGDAVPGPLLARTSGNFVDVIDDPERSTAEVRLVNTTWATYLVSWTVGTADGKTKTDKTLLPRCAPWRVDLDSLKIGWPPMGFKYEKLVDVGDGDLVFDFRRNDEYMQLNIAADVVALILGVGAESIRKVSGVGWESDVFFKANAAALQAAKELGALAGRVQGQTFAQASKEAGAYFLVNGGRILLAFWPLIRNEIKEEFVTVMGKVITKRMAALAVIGYGSVDLIAQLRALGDPAIATYTTGGLQLGGLYPFNASLDLSVTPKGGKTYVFQAVVSGLPSSFANPLKFVIEFGDGTSETVTPNIEAGQVIIGVRHTYGGEVPPKVRATLQTATAKPALLASREVDLPGEEPATAVYGTYSSDLTGALLGYHLILMFGDKPPGAQSEVDVMWVYIDPETQAQAASQEPFRPMPVMVKPNGDLVIGDATTKVLISCTPSADGAQLVGSVSMFGYQEPFTATRPGE